MLENNLRCFNKAAVSFNEKIGTMTNYDETYSFFCRALKGTDLLDLACGPANISRFLLNNWESLKAPDVSGSLNISLMDLSPEMLKLAAEYIPSAKQYCQSIVEFDLGKFDGIINGFGLPYLTLEEGLRHFENVYNSLREGGIFYLSFMNASDSKRNGAPVFTQDESPSFSLDSTLTITYWSKDFVVSELQKLGFKVLERWTLDYLERDGSITDDIVIIVQK